MHTLFCVSSPNTPYVYYGYSVGDNPFESFIADAHRDEPDRGDVRMYRAHGEDVDSLEFTILGQYDDEYDAWMARNDHRARDGRAITGPTMFPGRIAERAAKQDPARLAVWRKTAEARNAKTARSAWNLGLWSKDDVRALAERFGKDRVVKDLDFMAPAAFASQYDLPY